MDDYGCGTGMYRVGLSISRKVLQIMFWEVPTADWLICSYLPWMDSKDYFPTEEKSEAVLLFTKKMRTSL